MEGLRGRFWAPPTACWSPSPLCAAWCSQQPPHLKRLTPQFKLTPCIQEACPGMGKTEVPGKVWIQKVGGPSPADFNPSSYPRARATSSLPSCQGCWTILLPSPSKPIRHPRVSAQAAQACDGGCCSCVVQLSTSTEPPVPARYPVAASYEQNLAPWAQEEDRFPSLVTGLSNLKLWHSEALQLAVSAEHQPTLTFSGQWHSPWAPEMALRFLLALHNSTRGP